jgi:hypothetical protein
LWFIV